MADRLSSKQTPTHYPRWRIFQLCLGHFRGTSGLYPGPSPVHHFMNSITDLPLSSGAKLALYADDILLYKAVESPSDVVLLQQDVNLILQWFHDHGLTPNLSKTKLLQVNRSRTVPAVHISIDDYPLSPSKTVRYLGATLSSDLSWSEHINSVCKTANVTCVLSTESCIKHHPKFVLQYIAVLSFPNWTIVVLCGTHTTPLIRLHYIKSNHT